ncbi:MAG TPA: hypothetical protein DEA57_05385 [Sulfurihydrogenibium sp.]|uniref:hypothetical protein n=1 Tax=Sulfurihydrogenibium sp. (strain YO3AOP1) TaxID=436114 RepID=UPI0001726A64|nr:hypothetical protein [Sulfurihydrogenibium sp. YO3AOP1]ACD67165.1 conserved hypothetical protein [Sulfurihydrogenibium sp. YO3AOP1]HBT98888.1 hypothetical protein [Sulfurihydrogenibium sp.]
MTEIYKDTKIFVACPANVSTGGPELLHQLAYRLRRDLSIDAYMYYYNFDDGKFKNPVHREYEKYDNPFVTKLNEIEDNKKNIIIVPEIQEGINLLQHFKNIRKGVWFLSVDNYYLSKVYEKILFLDFNKLDLLSNKIEKLAIKFPYEKDPLLKLANFYLFQSHYAIDHFKNLEHKYYLSDYLNKDFLKIETDISNKEDIVAFNPKKGYNFTKKIIESNKDIKFIPLINMSREEVIETLQKAKVYIDFGNHPGKDRLPREAAILGCCIITGKRGSAAFFEDVPIFDEYKFEDREENIPKIVDKIKECFENYEERYKDFEHYREVIKNEPQRFVEDLKKIFVKV